jgi:hypothetical protein
MGGYRSLNAGDSVEFDYEPAGQNGFRFVATRARKLQQTRFTRRAGKPAPSPVCRHPAVAYAGPPRGGRCGRERG